MLGAGGNEVSDPPAVCEFSARSLRRDRRVAQVAPASARASDPAAPPPGITPYPNANREDTQVENLCYGMQRGAARAQEPALLAERSQDGEARAASS